MKKYKLFLKTPDNQVMIVDFQGNEDTIINVGLVGNSKPVLEKLGDNDWLVMDGDSAKES